MTAVGASAAFARIANIESRVGSLRTTTMPEFGDVLDRATTQTESAATVQSLPRPITIGDLVGQSLVGVPIGAPTFTSRDDWVERLPAAGRAYADAITEAAEGVGLDPALLAALVWTESDFHADAVSPSGAIGLGQLMPGTAEGLDVDPTDPVANLDGAARFLSYQIDQFGSIELGLAAYNAGPTRVSQSGGIPDIAETQAYVPKVLNRFRFLGGAS